MDAAWHFALSDVVLRVDHLEEVIIYLQNRSWTELGCDHHRNLEGGRLGLLGPGSALANSQRRIPVTQRGRAAIEDSKYQILEGVIGLMPGTEIFAHHEEIRQK
jgi:hypothetical protein